MKRLQEQKTQTRAFIYRIFPDLKQGAHCHESSGSCYLQTCFRYNKVLWRVKVNKNLSVKTIETYIDHIKKKMGFKDSRNLFLNAVVHWNLGDDSK